MTALFLCLGCSSSGPLPAEDARESPQLEARPSYARTLEIPAACDQTAEVERLGCAIEHAIEQPDFEPSRRACALRHMRPIRQALQAVVQSALKLEEIRKRRSPALAEPSAMGPPGLAPNRLLVDERPVADSRAAERALRDERDRQAEEVVLDERSQRAVAKLADLFHYVEPCLDARVPFEPPPRPAN